jgi:hypothetical protein
MTFKRRLTRLECQPKTPRATEAALVRKFQKTLALPVPEYATDDERAECLRLMKVAQARLKIDGTDHGGLEVVRQYALSMHQRYATSPFWGESSPFE